MVDHAGLCRGLFTVCVDSLVSFAAGADRRADAGSRPAAATGEGAYAMTTMRAGASIPRLRSEAKTPARREFRHGKNYAIREELRELSRENRGKNSVQRRLGIAPIGRCYRQSISSQLLGAISAEISGLARRLRDIQDLVTAPRTCGGGSVESTEDFL